MKLAWTVAVVISLSCGPAKAGTDPSFVSGTWTGTAVFQLNDEITACPEVTMRFSASPTSYSFAGSSLKCGELSRDDPSSPPTTSGRTGKSISVTSPSGKSATTAFTSTIRSWSAAA